MFVASTQFLTSSIVSCGIKCLDKSRKICFCVIIQGRSNITGATNKIHFTRSSVSQDLF